MDGTLENRYDATVAQIANHPVSRHRKAAPATAVTAEQAAELARPHLRDVGSIFDVRSGEEFRDKPFYGPRMPVPLEEMWFVAASGTQINCSRWTRLGRSDLEADR